MSLNKGRIKVSPDQLESEESDLSVHARSPRVLGVGVKAPKGGATKSRKQIVRPQAEQEKPDLMREAGTTAPPKEKHSQATSWDHLTKLDRLPSLRVSDSRSKGKGTGHP